MHFMLNFTDGVIISTYENHNQWIYGKNNENKHFESSGMNLNEK